MAASKPRVWLQMTQSDATFNNSLDKISVSGRPGWAIKHLKANGLKGLRTIDCPATQLPFYIWQLRQIGVVIETIMEEHGGPFAGHHARYVLRTPLRIVPPPEKTKPAGGKPCGPLNSKSELASEGVSE